MTHLGRGRFRGRRMSGIALLLDVRRPIRLSQELAILDYQVSFDRSLCGQPEGDSEIALGLLLDGVTLPDVFFNVLQGRTVAFAELAHSLAYDLADVRRLGNLERLGLQTTRVLVRGLALVEDFEHIATLYGNL